MSAMARRHRSEQRRLLGLRRVVHYTMAAQGSSPATRPPVAEIKAGITPKVKA